MSQATDRIPLAEDARLFHEARMRQVKEDQEKRERARRDRLVRCAMEDLCRVDITVGSNDVRFDDNGERLTLTCDGLTFSYDDLGGAGRRQWWLLSPCPECDEEVAFPISMQKRELLLRDIGQALYTPFPNEFHRCPVIVTDRKELPRLRTISHDQPLCTKFERDLLDNFGELVRHIHDAIEHVPE